jgi:hypothetical protein
MDSGNLFVHIKMPHLLHRIDKRASYHTTRLEQLLDFALAEVGYTNSLDFAGRKYFLQCLPCINVGGLAHPHLAVFILGESLEAAFECARVMHKEQINIMAVKVFQRCIQSGPNILGVVGVTP